VLPAFLEKLGWKARFTSRGGGAFPLAPGESRNVDIRLVPGRDFSASDVDASADKTIQIFGYAGGILVGGMSYVVDPKQTPPAGAEHTGQCAGIAGELLACIDLRHERVRRVGVRKVTVDLEIDDDCHS